MKVSGEAGFSIAAVLVVAGVLSAILAGLVGILSYSIKATKSAEDKADFLDLNDNVIRTMKYDDLCATALGGTLLIPNGPGGTPRAVSPLQLAQYTLTTGQLLPGSQITITQINVIDQTAGGPSAVDVEDPPGTFLTYNRHLVDLQIRGLIPNRLGGGLRDVVVPLIVFVDGGNAIRECNSVTDLNQACQEAGGVYDSARPISERCRPGGVKTQQILSRFRSAGQPGAIYGLGTWELCQLTGATRNPSGPGYVGGCRVQGAAHQTWNLIITKNALDGRVDCWTHCSNSWE